MSDHAHALGPLHALEDAGFPLHSLSPEQRAVLQGLSAEELTLLLGLKERLDAAEPEVQAHGEIAGGALF
ncbi:aroma-sacti cluster domain-containing protein [Streptomyces sp. Z26]|uniref:aroma-sacti cluster domain-containing protein n=1 Tax=Streptomyces TaxID=1883 RepID=UPI000EF1476D|nr:aroma-sacti cluster domain-containing protein [Streptomyces sp. Z26]RLL69329.1 hypothetical protein D7M15_23640 [Streptomyces sp. Z26]